MPRDSRARSAAGRLLLGAGLAAAAACSLPFAAPPSEWHETRVIHGTPVTIAVRDPDEGAARVALETAFEAAQEIGSRLLDGVRGTEIDILVHVPSHVWVEISRTTYDALLDAFEVAEATEGAYDPTWPALLAVWGLADDREPHVPRDFEIDMALRRVDWEDLEVDDQEGLQARRLSRRTEIRLGGLARGAMLDGAVAQLRLAGVRAGRASTPDEHALFGATRRHPWRVELPEGAALLRNGAIAVARRGPPIETANDGPIHDRFDPRSGRPAEGSRWVAVASQRASRSSAYADAVFAMGRDGPAFVAERSELLAVIEAEDGSRWVSEKLGYLDE
jgi:thiamine biosynthesis lipoprotein